MGSLLATLVAQAPPAAATAESSQMLATKEYLFVVHDGVLHQFDINTLKLRNTARLLGSNELLPATAQAASAQADQSNAAGSSPAAGPADPEATPPPKPPTAAHMSKVVERALTWLQAHQDKDGKWDADGFMKHDAGGELCNGPGNAVHDVGVTGLAVMALLTAGDDYQKEVRRAVSWLQRQQSDKGLFGGKVSFDYIYDHAIATLAVCKALQVLDRKDALMIPMAQKALDYLESHRNPYSVWRYQPRDNDNDTSVTAWCLLAYTVGKDVGLEINESALQLGSVWLDQVSSPNGHVGYTKAGQASSRKPGDHSSRFPVANGEAMTAAALLCRFELKEFAKRKELMNRSADLLIQKLPSWNAQAGTIDEVYWFFGTLALQHAGGEVWSKWSQHLAAATAAHQQQQGNLAGSWDPAGVWGEDGGRVFATALLAMASHATLTKLQ